MQFNDCIAIKDKFTCNMKVKGEQAKMNFKMYSIGEMYQFCISNKGEGAKPIARVSALLEGKWVVAGLALLSL